ncbi:MAG: dihydrodipicolinate reductase [Roseovarius sp.]
MRLTVFVFLAALAGSPAAAQEFDQIDDRDEFLSVVASKNLTRLGITLTVTPSGQIEGKAFGKPVTGAWQWKSGYFCRDLYWGQRNLGPNCQAVRVRGSTVRFVSDQGTGEHADLRLQ